MSASPARPPFPPLLVIAFGILATSTASIFIRYAQQDAPSLVIAALRLTIASLVLAPLALTRHRAELRALTRRQTTLLVLSGIFLAIHFATWISSLEYTTVASSVVFVSTTPLWVALLTPLTVRERLGTAVWAGMTVALLGGTVIGLSDTCILSRAGVQCPPLAEFVRGQAFLGDALALLGALAAAAYILIGRSVRSKLSLIPYIFVVYGTAAITLLVVMTLAGQSAWGHPPPVYLWVTLLALVPQLLGHSSFNWALRYISAAYVAITLLGEPVGSTILAYFLLHETPGVLKILGAVMIFIGIVAASRAEARP